MKLILQNVILMKCLCLLNGYICEPHHKIDVLPLCTYLVTYIDLSRVMWMQKKTTCINVQKVLS